MLKKLDTMPFIVGRFTSFYLGIVFDETFFVIFKDILRLYFRKTIIEFLIRNIV